MFVYCEVVIPVHLMCTQCVCEVLQRIDVCVRFICVLHSPHIHLTGPGFSSTSPAWSRADLPALFRPGRGAGSPKKRRYWAPLSGGRCF